MATQTTFMSPISMIVQYLTDAGIIAQGAQIFTIAAGTVNTPADTYSDSTGLVKNPNPVLCNSAGRPGANDGSRIAFWTLPGVALKLVVTDAAGNILVGGSGFDNITAIGDLAAGTNSLSSQLANPASSNSTGTGPVAGADLVANAVKSYDVFANLRAANAPVLASGQTLNVEVQAASTVGDGLGGFFFYAPGSTLADDNATVIKPTALTNAQQGRYLRYYPRGVSQIVSAKVAQQVANSTALVNDNELVITLPASSVGGVFLIQERLVFNGLSTNGQGYKSQLTSSGVGFIAGINSGIALQDGNGGYVVGGAFVNTPNIATAVATGPDSLNTDILIQTSGQVTLTHQFAQNASAAGATVRAAGSSIIVTRMS